MVQLRTGTMSRRQRLALIGAGLWPFLFLTYSLSCANAQEINRWSRLMFPDGREARLRLRDNHHYDLQDHSGSLRQGKWKLHKGVLCLQQRRPWSFDGAHCLGVRFGSRGELQVLLDVSSPSRRTPGTDSAHD